MERIKSELSENTLLSFYNVSTLHPTSLQDLNIQTDLDPFDLDELEGKPTDEQFSILNQLVYREAGISASSKSDTQGSDDVDPLSGNSRNIVQELLGRQIITSVYDPNLRHFLISSKEFDSKQYISVLHENSTIEDLSASLSFLDQNIQSQTDQLKKVINANYVSFINSKQAIDNVLVDFKNSKTHAQQERDRSKVFNPQRQKNLSKSTSLSGDLEEAISNLQVASDLTMRPIEEHTVKELKIQRLIEFVKENKFFFDLPNKLLHYISAHDHNQFIDDYNRFLKEKKEIVESKERSYKRILETLDRERDKEKIRDVDIDRIVSQSALSRVFTEVDNIVSEYRKKIYKELITMDHEAGLARGNFGKDAANAKFISFVDTLYQLDNEGKTTNPIHEFLTVQLNSLKRDLDYQNNKFDAKFTMMQRKLLDYIGSLAEHREGGSFIRHITEKYNTIEDIFRTSSTTSTTPSHEEREKLVIETFENSDNLDLSIINETWLVLTNYINYLDELFLKNLSKFVNNYLHYTNSDNGYVVDINGKIRDSFLNLIRDATSRMVRLFNNNEAIDQITSTPQDYTHFLPYNTNSLSTIFYLTTISKRVDHWLTRVGEHAVVVGNTSKNVDTNKFVKLLRDSSTLIDQKLLEACCSAWVNDCSQFYDIETWEKNSQNFAVFADRGSDYASDAVYTRAMRVLESYEAYILTKLSQLVFDKFVPSSTNEPIKIISSHPSKRILVSLEIQFMRSMNVLIDAIMKKYNLEKQRSSFIASTNAKTGAVDINNNIENDLYKVLTMNNFDVLSKNIFPRLIKKFDSLYDKNLSDQNLKLYADIDKASLTIFDDISAKEKEWISIKLSKHFRKVGGNYRSTPQITLKIDSFIYEILIHFVKLVHIVKPLTGIEIFTTMINDLQTFFLNLFLSHLREIKQNEGFQEYCNLKLDLHFFLEIFEPSESFRLNDHCMNLVNIINKSIEESEGNPHYSSREFQAYLDQALKDSASEFVFLER